MVTFTEQILNGKIHFLCSVTDKSETQIKVAKLPERSSVNNNINSMFNESIPSKSLTHYITTLYHSTSTHLIQGSKRTFWVKKEFRLLKKVLNQKKHCTTSIKEACNQIPELPKKHQREQLPTGKTTTPLPSIDTSIIPENETKENTSINQPQTIKQYLMKLLLVQQY